MIINFLKSQSNICYYISYKQVYLLKESNGHMGMSDKKY